MYYYVILNITFYNAYFQAGISQDSQKLIPTMFNASTILKMKNDYIICIAEVS